MKKSIFIMCIGIVTTCYAAPPAIVQSGERFTIIAPATITEPGTYYVGRDFVGTITVAASDVYLDLNGKTLENTGNSIIVNGQENVFIYNGQIQNTTDHAIRIDDCSNVSVADITFSGIETLGVFVSTSSTIDIHDVAVLTSTCYGGFYGEYSQNITVHDCAINNNVFIPSPLIPGSISAGYCFSTCTNTSLNNCTFQSNNSSDIMTGFLSIGTTSVLVKNCTVVSCEADDMRGFGIVVSQYCVLTNCIVSNNRALTGQFFGIVLEQSIGQVMECIVVDNSVVSSGSLSGFDINSALVEISNCVASNNSGPTSVRGFDVNGGQDITISQCISSNNSSEGGAAVGFDGESPQRCIWRENSASYNIGFPSTDSYGFRFTGAPTLCTLFANQAEGHDSEANNFSVGTVSIPKVIFRRASNIWSAPPTPVDNISIEES